MSLKNKKVVITGADGFIGSHLTEALVEQGCRVKAFCYYNYLIPGAGLIAAKKE